MDKSDFWSLENLIFCKGKFPPVPEHHDMKVCGGVEIKIHAFQTSAPDGGKWLASGPRCPLDRRLGGFQSRFEHDSENESLAPAGNGIRSFSP
jgi:hypothetical protein